MSGAAGAKVKRDDLIRENEHLRTVLTVQRRQSMASNCALVSRSAVRCGFLGAATWLSVREIAGKETQFHADATASLPQLGESLSALSPPWWMLLLLLFVTLTSLQIAVAYRRLYKGTVVRLGNCNRRYEQLFDPQRTGSGVTDAGQTNPRDKQ